MAGFSNVLLEQKSIKQLKDFNSSGNSPAGAIGVSYIHKVFLAGLLCADRGGLVIVPNESDALKTVKDLNATGVDAAFFPARELVFGNVEASSREYERGRLSVLYSMLFENKTVVCSIDAAMLLTIPPQELMKHSFILEKGGSVELESFLKTLSDSGYVRAPEVDAGGQFSVRGGIVDVFSPCCDRPVRFELWGDEIEDMFYFDVESQRRVESVNSFTVIPASELIFNRDELADKVQKLASSIRKKDSPAKEGLFRDAELLRGGSAVLADRFLPLIYENEATVFDYLGDKPLIVFESGKVKENAKSFLFRMNEDVVMLFEEGVLCKGLDRYYLDYTEIVEIYEKKKAVYMDMLPRGSFDTPVGYLLNLNAKQFSPWCGSKEVLTDDLEPLHANGYTCVVACPTARGARTVCDELINDGYTAVYYEKIPEAFPRGAVSVVPCPVSASMDFPEIKFALLAHSVSGSSAREPRKKKSSAPSLTNLEELRFGDYVVHSVHGIGVFEGVQNVEFQGVKKDYIKIRYAGGESIYVPVTHLDLVSRYIGARDENKIKLSKLGTADWQRTKSRARAAASDIADELIKLYTERSSSQGHAFAADGELQRDFESLFEFEETEDQLRCAREIKDDMEKLIPMDRLLCGDVGFGKTEVALRAAFKCVCEGKQCVILVPTTILAFQHYTTIKKRFENYPIEVRMLSRFCDAKEVRETKKELKNGKADIVVGTHKLLSGDISFHDVGLLIVDEEQRFGVKQKEKLKELFPRVDVLTLSATPIPRTLNMAMSGIRDMSVLEEAPQNRYPVQTYVLEHDDAILAGAMRKEISRGGQCYYLHNNIDTISRTAMKIKAQLEDARVAVAHGRMNEEELSDIWRRLLLGEIDVLVCTTIIETGVDVPNVNTLIIEDADRMGLSQLHQIRGRVGRSQRRAFAYLTYRKGKQLSEIAQCRLEAIREFTQFGAGFKIAMKDLEIRGAGNLLGAQQHGHMEAVGYEMYMKLLAEAVKEKKGEVSEVNKPDCLVDLQIEAYIPEFYIPSTPHRLSIYRKIADIRTEEDAQDVIAELKDRFGKPPKSVLGLIDVALLRNRAANLNIYEVRSSGREIRLFISDADPQRILKLAKALKKRISFGAASKKDYMAVKMLDGQQYIDTLKEVITAFEKTAE